MFAKTAINHIAKWSTVKLEGGVSSRDCYSFAMEWVKDSGGPDLTGWAYKNYREAAVLVRREGYSHLFDYIDEHLKSVDKPSGGDVIAAKSNDDWPAFGIWHDGRAWIVGKDGKIIGAETKIEKAWTWQRA